MGSFALGGKPGTGTTMSIANTDYKTICDPTPYKIGTTRPFLKVASGTVRVSSIAMQSVKAQSTQVGTNRCPAFPQFPDASCTGTLPGVARSEFNGVKYTSKDGEVIENLNINGEIRVEHNNVTIRNVRVKSNGGNAIYIHQKTNLLIEDCELNGQSGNAETAVVHGE
ncbi:hypothetical protein E6P97_01290 [Patescibacteria group bacterium]|nr:MAG: hypothetical protein E6P97_01290 [Patescibacteria group bacterium]